MTGLVVTLLIVGALLVGGALLMNALLRRWVDAIATYAEGIATLLEGNDRAISRLDGETRAGFATQNARLKAEAEGLLDQLSDPPPGALRQLWFSVTPSALLWQQMQEPLAAVYGRAQSLAEQIQSAPPAHAQPAPPAADATQPMSASVTQPMPASPGLLSPPSPKSADENLQRLLARAKETIGALPVALSDRAAMRAVLLSAEQQLGTLPADDNAGHEALAQRLERLHASAQRLGLDYTRLTAGLPVLRALLEDRRAALAAATSSDPPFAWGDTLNELDRLTRDAARAAELPPSLSHDAIKARIDELRELHDREKALAARIDQTLAQRDGLAALLRRSELAPERPWLRLILLFDQRVGTPETAALVAATTPLVQQHDALLANVATLREEQVAERYAEASALRQAVYALGVRARAMVQGARAVA